MSALVERFHFREFPDGDNIFVRERDYLTLQSRLEAVEAERDAAKLEAVLAAPLYSRRQLEARVEELQKALEPFEEVADEGNEDQPDDTPCTIQAGRSTCYGFTLKQFRDLRALLSHLDPCKGGEE